jgi:hypothetical protein
MTPTAILAALDQRQTLALTAWAEARAIPRDIPSDHSPVEELIAVMVVVRNRRKNFARFEAHSPIPDASYKSICLSHAQFSCWNPNSGGPGTNHDALMALAAQLVDEPGPVDLRVDAKTILESPDPVFDEPGGAPDPFVSDPLLRECLYLADGVIAGTLIDRTGGADSYYAPAAMVPRGRLPDGARGKTLEQIGDQYFYTAYTEHVI